MKNKKGFTLVEVLVVVGIISILMLIAIPSIMFVTKRINIRLYDTKKEMLLSSAEMYGQDNKATVFTSGTLPTTATITIKTLIDNDYVESDGTGTYKGTPNTACVIDPRDKSCIEDDIILTYTTRKKVKSSWTP